MFSIRAFLSWLPLGVAITGICLLVYATVQQKYRQTLNDPQIQMAEDAAARLAGGEAPAALVPREAPPVDIGGSLASWLAVYDASGTPLESSAVLDNAPPRPPQGVFDDAASGRGKDTAQPHENRITWQPNPDVRQAIVVVEVTHGPRTGYFVVAGRNMREVEEREGRLGSTVMLAWIVLLGATFFTATSVEYLQARYLRA